MNLPKSPKCPKKSCHQLCMRASRNNPCLRTCCNNCFFWQPRKLCVFSLTLHLWTCGSLIMHHAHSLYPSHQTPDPALPLSPYHLTFHQNHWSVRHDHSAQNHRLCLLYVSNEIERHHWRSSVLQKFDHSRSFGTPFDLHPVSRRVPTAFLTEIFGCLSYPCRATERKLLSFLSKYPSVTTSLVHPGHRSRFLWK